MVFMKTRILVFVSSVVVCAALAAVVYTLYWYFDMGHAAVAKVPVLDGKTIEEVELLLGTPDTVVTISLDQVLDDFRGPLLNHYSRGKPENREVEFKELSWKRSRYTITAWFHRIGNQWLCLETCRWQNGVVF